MSVYVETDCTITHEGREYTSGGAYYDGRNITAYPAGNGNLCDWHGNRIGLYVIVSRWPVNSWIGSEMCQIDAYVDGVWYTGRGFGDGMLYRGKRKARQ